MSNLIPSEQGVDHSCDRAAIHFFSWRFPKLELVAFFACRNSPYTHPRHIVCFEGNRSALVGYELVPPELIPTGLRRRRNGTNMTVRRLRKDRFLVRLILWNDAPLASSHPFAPLCPSRWPIIDSAEEWKDYMRRLLPLLETPRQVLDAVRSTMLGYRLAEKDVQAMEAVLEACLQEFRKRFEAAKVVHLRDTPLTLIKGVDTSTPAPTWPSTSDEGRRSQ